MNETNKTLLLTALIAAAGEVIKSPKQLEKLEEAFKPVIDDFKPTRTNSKRLNIEDFTRKDENGDIVEVLCSTSNVWLPATLEFFYADKSDRGANTIVLKDGTQIRRLSRQAEKISKLHAKQKRASIASIMSDMSELDVTDTEAVKSLQEELKAIQASKPDFSSVTATKTV